jgi:hypothetical protein
LPAQELAAFGVQVVVVDNASTDATPTLLADYARRARFTFRHLREPRPGKSHALNAGLAATDAQLVAFTDDDCVLEPGYFAAVRRHFATGRLHYAGGRQLPLVSDDAPIGLNTSTEHVDLPPGSYLRPGLIQGGNLVVAREVFARVGGFDTALGPSTRWRFEDLELVARASLAGFSGAYLPDLVVRHHYGDAPGARSSAQQRANAWARGGYHMHFITRGHRAYLGGWLRGLARNWRLDWTVLELAGAIDYRRRASGGER